MSELSEFRRAKDDYFRTGSGSPLDAATKTRVRGAAIIFPRIRRSCSSCRSSATQSRAGSRCKRVPAKRRNTIGSARCISPSTARPRRCKYMNRSTTRVRSLSPFVDATWRRRRRTVPACYLEPEEHHAGELTLDFNYAYNPYCAYDPRKWSCPLPPAANRAQGEDRSRGEQVPRVSRLPATVELDLVARHPAWRRQLLPIA